MPARCNFFLAMVALIALLSASIVPPGMMLAGGGEGFTVTLCSPKSGSKITIDQRDSDYERLRQIERAKRVAAGKTPAPDHSEEDTSSMHCAFAGMNSGAGLLPETLRLPAQIDAPSVFGAGTALPLVVQQRAYLPPATGPPALL